MIKKVRIQNFQSHKDTELLFVPGVNVIVGNTDSGKTAILRALRWANWNRPVGEAFRSTWGGDTEVQIDTEDGHCVVRGKGQDNFYKVDEKLLHAFGTTVPEEVQKILNINEINFQRQFDAPFLLNSTAGEVASHFNRLAHIDLIDISNRKIKAWIKDIQKNKNIEESKIAQYRQELSEFDYLEDLETDVSELEEKQTRLDMLRKDVSDMSIKIQAVEKQKNRILFLQEFLANDEETVHTLEQSVSHYLELEERINTLSSLIVSIEEQSQIIEELTEELSLESIVTDMLKKVTFHTEMQRKRDQLKSLIFSIESVIIRIAQLTTTLEQQKAEFSKKMPDVCPLCEQPIPHTH